MNKTLFAFCLSIASIALMSTTAAAQNYPERPVRLVVPFGAGSATDTLTRVVADGMSKRMGQPVVVENRAGAAGAIGSGVVASAKPDGYTLIMGTNGPFAANPSLYKDLAYDPIQDFEPIILMGRLPMILVASPSLEVNSLEEALELAAQNSDKINFGASNTTGQVWAELIKTRNDLDVATILYSQVGGLMTDVMANRVSYAFENVGPTRPLIEAGKLKALAVTSDQRVDFISEVPTLVESGVNDLRLDVWFVMFAPKGTPPEIIERLNTELNAVLQTEDVKRVSNQISMLIAGGSAQELAQYQLQEVEHWRQLIELTGVQVN